MVGLLGRDDIYAYSFRTMELVSKVVHPGHHSKGASHESLLTLMMYFNAHVGVLYSIESILSSMIKSFWGSSCLWQIGECHFTKNYLMIISPNIEMFCKLPEITDFVYLRDITEMIQVFIDDQIKSINHILNWFDQRISS